MSKVCGVSVNRRYVTSNISHVSPGYEETDHVGFNVMFEIDLWPAGSSLFVPCTQVIQTLCFRVNLWLAALVWLWLSLWPFIYFDIIYLLLYTDAYPSSLSCPSLSLSHPPSLLTLSLSDPHSLEESYANFWCISFQFKQKLYNSSENRNFQKLDQKALFFQNIFDTRY